MPTDSERRKVAARLREYIDWRNRFSGDPVIERLCRATGISFNPGTPIDYQTECALVKRLADLIEPEPKRTCHMIDNGVELCCSECDYRHSYDDEPKFCMGCGARVVETTQKHI